MFDDEFYDESEMGDPELYEKEVRAMAKQEFINGCYEAYDVLVTQGKAALQEAEISSIQRAINKMTALFIVNEEFERCSFLQRFVAENMPGFKIEPDPTVEKELNSI